MSAIIPKTLELADGTKVHLRSAAPDDAAVLVAYVQAVVNETDQLLMSPGEFKMTVEQERDWIQRNIDNPRLVTVLAEVDGQPIGLLSFECENRKKIQHQGSVGISIRQAWRSQGIGTAMLTALLDWARENPLIEKVSLQVMASNTRAIALYKRFGFVEEGRLVRMFKLAPGVYCDDLQMGCFVKEFAQR